MNYYAFNIGKPYTDSQWAIHLELGIITTGFEGVPGDDGERILRKLKEGDWLLAYANKHGFIGAGVVGPESTYRLVPKSQLPANWQSHHRHFREVKWFHAISTLEHGVAAKKVGRQAPRQTMEKLPEDVANQLIQLLIGRMGANAIPQIDFTKAFAEQVKNSASDTSLARTKRLQSANRLPQRMPVLTYEFVRNPDVVAEVLYQAKGVCAKCKCNAPFKKRIDGSPYLEVHHRVPLAEGGEDTVKNAVALCPNCHREFHYGMGA